MASGVRAAGDVGSFAQATGYNNGGEDSDGKPAGDQIGSASVH